jgi:hypothetical protein
MMVLRPFERRRPAMRAVFVALTTSLFFTRRADRSASGISR